jgi:hypothetical protein
MLMALDTLAVLWMGGLFAPRRIRRSAAAAAAGAGAGSFWPWLLGMPARAQPDDAKPGDADAIDAMATTRLAYVITGDSSIDAISRAGLTG